MSTNLPLLYSLFRSAGTLGYGDFLMGQGVSVYSDLYFSISLVKFQVVSDLKLQLFDTTESCDDSQDKIDKIMLLAINTGLN